MNHPPAPNTDPVWHRLRKEAQELAASEPMLAGFLHDAVLKHPGLDRALAFFLAEKLATRYLAPASLVDLFTEALLTDPSIGAAVRKDLSAVQERDPAARGLTSPFLFFKGFQALETYRLAHWFWVEERRTLALYLQSRCSEVFNVDIHPAARIGSGVFIDHGTGVVIGETAVVGDDVSLLHEVTLGGTGKETGDRHPKIGNGVLLGAGAKILGNITIGDGSKIAACSVVLGPIPPHSTAAGIPAKVIGKPATLEPALQMDQQIVPQRKPRPLGKAEAEEA
jgi:serine O-acetyltransferase